MAYTVKVWHNTAGVEIDVSLMTWGIGALNYTLTYTNSATAYVTWTMRDGDTVTVTAKATGKYTFVRWEYRIDNGSWQISTLQEFSYTGGEDIEIRSVSKSPESGDDSGGEGDTTTIERWSWESSNGSASDYETIEAYYALVNKTSTRNFSHNVWNDMVDKIHELFVENVGTDWDGSFHSYNNTRMTETPYYMTAKKFNSLLHQIPDSQTYRKGLEYVDSGDVVLGSYFLTLAECINYCIDKFSK